jgi:hypothetical protein
LHRILQEAHQERKSINTDLSSANYESDMASALDAKWTNGFLFRRIFKAKFARIKTDAETAKARRDELAEQLRLTTVATQVEIDADQAEPYYRMRDEFAALSNSRMIWDTVSEQAIDGRRERSIAVRAISRTPVRFSLGACDLIEWDQKVPKLGNANGGDLYLFPGFILFYSSHAAFSIVDFTDVKLSFIAQAFHETDGVPADSTVVGHIWLKANKDGSPDRRFANNHKIPIAAYGKLVFTSSTGMREEYLCSNAELTARFANAWETFERSLDGGGDK